MYTWRREGDKTCWTRGHYREHCSLTCYRCSSSEVCIPTYSFSKVYIDIYGYIYQFSFKHLYQALLI